MIYTIYGEVRPPADLPKTGDDSRFDDLVAIPDGLATWALIVPPVWLAIHKLWWTLAVFALLTILAFGLLATPVWPVSIALGGLPGLYLLLEGRELLRRKLEADGLDLVGLVDASSESGAIARFLDQWSLPSSLPHHSPPKSSPLLNARAGQTGIAFAMFPTQE